jgi:hypothetical protein
MKQKNNAKTAPTMKELRHRNNAHANLLKRSSPLYRKALASQTLTALGQTARFKVVNSGYLTGFYVTMTLANTIGTATATLSPRGIYGAINRIRLTDYAQQDRINVSGYQLFLRNSVNSYAGNMAGMCNVPSAGSTFLNSAGLTSPMTNPDIKLTAGNNVQKVTFYVPVCKDIKRGDLRGMLDSEQVEGECYLNIELASLLYANGSDEYMFNGAATTTATLTSATFDVVQEFYYPQRVGDVLPRPMLDLRTVYELAGAQRSTDNLSSGADKIINIMNNRTVRRVYVNYQNNGILGGSAGNELSRLKFVVGGSNYITDVNELQQNFIQLNDLGLTLPKGSYYWEFDHGLQTSSYGTAQLVVTPGGTLVNPYIETCFENLYTLGAPLSALV